jgi:hypothetical protein
MSTYNDGYKRGLDGKDHSSSWGDVVRDGFVNKTGSKSERQAGYEQGQRDRMRDQKKK